MLDSSHGHDPYELIHSVYYNRRINCAVSVGNSEYYAAVALTNLARHPALIPHRAFRDTIYGVISELR
jgi:hypothetical protein